MEHAYEMAVDALGLAITCRKEEGEKLPVPSLPDQIKVGNDAFLIIVEFDMLAYKKTNKFPRRQKNIEHSPMVKRRSHGHRNKFFSGSARGVDATNPITAQDKTKFVKGSFYKSYILFNKYANKPFRAVLVFESCSEFGFYSFNSKTYREPFSVFS